MVPENEAPAVPTAEVEMAQPATPPPQPYPALTPDPVGVGVTPAPVAPPAPTPMPEPAVQPELHTVAHADIPDMGEDEVEGSEDAGDPNEDPSEDEEVVSEDAWNYGDFGLMTEEDLAYAFGLTKNTLAKWRKNTNPEDQSGPSYIRIGKSVFYHEGHVMQWIARNVVHQDPPVAVTKAPGASTVADIAAQAGAKLN